MHLESDALVPVILETEMIGLCSKCHASGVPLALCEDTLDAICDKCRNNG